MLREAKKEVFWFFIIAIVVNLMYFKKDAMQIKLILFKISGWLAGTFVFLIGLLNILLVHPVPGTVYVLLSFVYLPPVNGLLKKKFGFSIPLVVKIILGFVIFWFTLGVSDLGDMID